MKNRKIAFLIMLLFAVLASAGTIVDQGRPGSMGAWVVSGPGGAAINVAKTSTGTQSGGAGTTTTVNANASPCTTPGGASCTIIYPATSWLGWPNLTITINNSGVNPLNEVNVEWSPDNVTFYIWDKTTFASLASGTMKDIAIAGNSRNILRIEARAAATVTSAVVFVSANQN